MLEIKTKMLNKQEQYPCSVADIKRLFLPDENLFVSFGFLGRSFSFDHAFIKRPKINGVIITSLSINNRLNVIDCRPILSLYFIKDDRYNKKLKLAFLDNILPRIYSWYKETLSKLGTSIPGVEQILIEWTGEDFIVHCCRFA